MFWPVLLVVAAVHAALFVLDVLGGEGFFRADRVPQRLGTILTLIEQGRSLDSLVAVLARQGNIGDYGIHAALFACCGRLGVTSFQVLLAVPAAACVAYIAFHATASRGIAVASGLVYGLLPQSLAFPHQLLSEALSNPFLIFGVAILVRALTSGGHAALWSISGLFFGLAGLVRPALMPLFAIAFAIIALQARHLISTGRAARFLTSALAPFMLWSMFMLSQTGSFGLGESNQDLGLNFSQSTAKVLLSEGLAAPGGAPPAWLPQRLTPSEYLQFVGRYPAGFANLYAKNLLVLVTDSGVGRLYVDLLGFGADARAQLQDPISGWRAQLTNHGLLAMLRQGFAVAPGTILAGLLGAAAFALITLGTIAGYVAMLGRDSPLRSASGAATPVQRWTVTFLLILPVYVLLTSQVVAYAPSRLRSQGEFAWATLACIGWTCLRLRYLAIARRRS
jgi:4-amino-4-deoxy-L-arabinose transferase-like glycosyltransferase